MSAPAPAEASRGPPRAVVVLLLLPAAAALVGGVWGGLLRAGVRLPVASAAALTHHGGLMVGAFLGTLIGVERAVALGGAWPWLAPTLTASGGLLHLAGAGSAWGTGALLAGSAVFTLATLAILGRQRALFTGIPVVGGAAWLWGNLQWWWGSPVPEVVHPWMAFLLLTITGERLELGRLRRPPEWAQRALAGLVAAAALAAGATAAFPERAVPAFGGVLLGIALWSWRFDVARVTIRTTGLARYVAACLLGGFLWLAVAGVLLVVHGPVDHGLGYDAGLHAFFLGYVVSMIFGHAPIVFPAVLRVPITYHPAFYAPAALLHLTLAARVYGGVAESAWWRTWGAAGNAAALAAFPLTLAGAALLRRRRGR